MVAVIPQQFGQVLMKSAFHCFVIPLCFVLQTSCEAQIEIEDGLSEALALVASSNASDRVSGFEKLGKIWNANVDSLSSGFSDTPVERDPMSEGKPELPDDSVDRIAKVIQRALADDNPKVRESAAIAICSAPRPRPEVISAITKGLNSDDTNVIWYVSQQAVKNLPPIETVIQSLIQKLDSDEFNSFGPASDVLKAYGVRARPYANQIVDVVLKSTTYRSLKLYVLFDIGLEGTAAEKLADAAADFTRDELGIAAVCLLDHFQLLTRVESLCPETIPALQEQMPRLYAYLCKHQLAANETRSWLARSDKLLPVTMGLMREERFVNKIAKEEISANSYEKILLAACKRACGANPAEQIKVDADHPVEFRPRSAWPKSDARRLSKTSNGHGDGVTFVMLTGEVRSDDGTHPASIEFFRINDEMLLGTKENNRQDVLYDSSTGRFVFYTSVFAAYSIGVGQPDPGPYQTGSAQIRVEAADHQPLTLQFFDEMPDVIITLSPKPAH